MSSKLVTALNDELIALRKENAELKAKLEEMDLEKLWSKAVEKYKNINIEMGIFINQNGVNIEVNNMGCIFPSLSKKSFLEAIKTFRQKLEEMK